MARASQVIFSLSSVFLCLHPLLELGVRVVGRNKALPQDHEDSTPRTHARGMVVWQNGNSRCPRGSQCPICLCPTMEKVQPCLYQGGSKIQCPEFLLHSKAQSFGAHSLSRALVAARPAWSGALGKREHANAWGKCVTGCGGGERERECERVCKHVFVLLGSY